MSSTLLRLGLWLVVLLLVLLLLQLYAPELPLVRLATYPLLERGFIAAAILIVAGVAFSILGKGARVVTQNRCATCRAPIGPSAIYCSNHLRTIVENENDRSHTRRKK